MTDPTLIPGFLTPFLGSLPVLSMAVMDLLVAMSLSSPLTSMIPEAGTLSLHSHTLIPGAEE